MKLVDRVKNIILSPRSEWQVIDGETTDVATLYKEYIVILAAIGPVCGLIGMTLFGIPMLGRPPFGSTLGFAVTSYVLALAGVFIVSLIINALAPTFSGQKDGVQALKVAAYAYTPAWVGGVFSIIPVLGVLGLLLALYGLYVLYLGLPVLMKAPQDKALGYTIVVIIVTMVVMFVFNLIAGSMLPTPEIAQININVPQMQGN